jgi:hypothetical protein
MGMNALKSTQGHEGTNGATARDRLCPCHRGAMLVGTVVGVEKLERKKVYYSKIEETTVVRELDYGIHPRMSLMLNCNVQPMP